MKNRIKMAFYVDFVNQFFKTGRIPPLSIAISANNPFRDSDDSIIDYLRNHFSKMELFKDAFQIRCIRLPTEMRLSHSFLKY